MVLTIPNWDIERSVLREIHTKTDTSLVGASFQLPPLGYIVGDILSLNFEWCDDEKIHPCRDEAWFSLIQNDARYCDIAECAVDEENDSGAIMANTVLSCLRRFFDLTTAQPQYMDHKHFMHFLAFCDLPEPVPNLDLGKALVVRNFWTGAEKREDVKKQNEIIAAFNKDGGKTFFDTLERNIDAVDIVCNYKIRGFADLAYISAYLTLKAGKTLVRCAHCGRLFPPSRFGEIYCSRITPGGRQTCKEAAKYIKQLKRERASMSGKIYKSVNTMLAARANYAKDAVTSDMFRKELYDFRDSAREFRNQVKQGKRSEEEYITFLNSYKKRK